jgi:hypothetical protein
MADAREGLIAIQRLQGISAALRRRTPGKFLQSPTNSALATAVLCRDFKPQASSLSCLVWLGDDVGRFSALRQAIRHLAILAVHCLGVSGIRSDSEAVLPLLSITGSVSSVSRLCPPKTQLLRCRENMPLPPAQPVYILRGHSAPIHAVVFFRSNTRLITADSEGWVVLWDVSTRRPVAVWKAHDASVLGAAPWGEDRIITSVFPWNVAPGRV